MLALLALPLPLQIDDLRPGKSKQPSMRQVPAELELIEKPARITAPMEITDPVPQ